MNITVCFKTMADTALLLERDWVADSRLGVETGFVRRIFNCFDESALELALRLAQRLGEGGEAPELTALTMDDHRADTFLRLLLAAGFDRAVRIEPENEGDLRFNPRYVSRVLAAQIAEAGGQDLILAGYQGEGDNRQTGPLLAERLGRPCIFNVAGAVPAARPGRLTVTSRRDGVGLVQTVDLPLVLVAGNAAEAPYLRSPTLKQRMLAQKKPIEVRTVSDLGLAGPPSADSDISPAGMVRQRRVRQCRLIQGRGPAEKARLLYEHHLKGRLFR